LPGFIPGCSSYFWFRLLWLGHSRDISPLRNALDVAPIVALTRFEIVSALVLHSFYPVASFRDRNYSRDLRLAKWGSGISLNGSNPEPLMSALECAEQASSRACTVKRPHIAALTTKAFFRKCQMPFRGAAPAHKA
jgi:hypothetical protein